MNSDVHDVHDDSHEAVPPEDLLAMIPDYQEPKLEELEGEESEIDSDPASSSPPTEDASPEMPQGEPHIATDVESEGVELKRSPLPRSNPLADDPAFAEEAAQGDFLRGRLGEVLTEYTTKYGRPMDVQKISRVLCRIALKSVSQPAEIYFDSFKVGNAIGLFAPPIAALIHNPGANASQGDALESMQKIMHAADRFSDGLYRKLMARAGQSADDRRFDWVRNKMRTIATELVSKQWIVHSNVEMEPYLALFDDLLGRVDLSEDPAFLHFGDLGLNRDLALTLSLTKAIEPVMSEIRVFDFLHREHVSLIRDISEEILAAATDAVAPFAAKGADARNLLILTQSMINRAGVIYAACWAAEGEKVTVRLAEMEDALLSEFLEKYPDGLPLEQVKKNFKLSFDRFADVVRHSVASFDERSAHAPHESTKP